MHSSIRYGAAIGAFLALTLAGAALAQPGPGGIPTQQPLPGGTSVFNIINTIVTWAFGLLLVLAAVFILWAGFLYLTSGGDEDKTANAKKYLIYAVVAIVVGAIARVIVFIVQQLLGIPNPV